MPVNIHAINKIFEKKGINADIGIDTEDNDIIIFDSWDDYNKVRWIENSNCQYFLRTSLK